MPARARRRSVGRSHSPPPQRQRRERPDSLNDSELEVFPLIDLGLPATQIGHRLNLCIKTIATHREHIKQKLKLQTGPELIRQAVRWAAAQQLV